MKTRLLLLALVCLFLAPSFRAAAALPAQRWGQLTEEERYALKQAEMFFAKKDYKAAKSAYEHYLQLYGKSTAASYALLMFAECTRQTGRSTPPPRNSAMSWITTLTRPRPSTCLS